ncbi:hypothetical protein [Bacillus mycoides]|uniref:hypothetical protein n=1 Tax=Bacillus mycoides TaxID=1405 RepID=UPI003A807E8F
MKNKPEVKTYSGSLGIYEVIALLFKDIAVSLGTVTTSYIEDTFPRLKKHKGLVLSNTGMLLNVVVEFKDGNWVCEVHNIM